MPYTSIDLRRYRLVRNTVAVWLTVVVAAGFSFGGLAMTFPKIEILEHTARNLYFHVPMWFTMMAATGVSAWHALKVLRAGRDETISTVADLRSYEAARAAFLFGILGLLTGIFWSRFTWYVGTGLWWNFDPRPTMVVVNLLIYGAYFLLRGAVEEAGQRARISAVYNLFAFVTVPFLLYVVPRQMNSLHPGAEGNPAFSNITHPVMRLVFYPAVIGFIGLFWVLYTQRVRLGLTRLRIESRDLDAL
jgi:heme exporter protein C